MFLGEYEYVLDEKGRLFIPVKFRNIIKNKKQKTVIITKGFEKCLFVYPIDKWKEFINILNNSLSTFKKDARKIRRTFFASANENNLDSQGRISLPQNLRNYANLKKEIIIIGVENHLEIWDKQIWNCYSQEATEVYTDLADKIP